MTVEVLNKDTSRLVKIRDVYSITEHKDAVRIWFTDPMNNIPDCVTVSKKEYSLKVALE